MSRKNIEKAVNDYIHQETGGVTFPTGWVLIASLAPPTGDNSLSDSYITLSSDGLPAHAQLGLLSIAKQDMENMSMLGAIGRSVLGALLGGENEEDNEDEA